MKSHDAELMKRLSTLPEEQRLELLKFLAADTVGGAGPGSEDLIEAALGLREKANEPGRN